MVKSSLNSYARQRKEETNPIGRWPLRLDARAHSPSAVNRDRLASDVIRSVGSQKDRRSGQFRRDAGTPHRDHAHRAVVQFGVREDRVGHLRPEPSGRDRIDADVVFGEIYGQGTGHLPHSALADRVEGDVRNDDLIGD